MTNIRDEPTCNLDGNGNLDVGLLGSALVDLRPRVRPPAANVAAPAGRPSLESPPRSIEQPPAAWAYWPAFLACSWMRGPLVSGRETRRSDIREDVQHHCQTLRDPCNCGGSTRAGPRQTTEQPSGQRTRPGGCSGCHSFRGLPHHLPTMILKTTRTNTIRRVDQVYNGREKRVIQTHRDPMPGLGNGATWQAGVRNHNFVDHPWTAWAARFLTP